MADDLHQVLRADAVDPLLHRGTTRRGVRASSECGGDYSNRKKLARVEISSQAFPVSWGHHRPVLPSSCHSVRDATLLQIQHQTQTPIALLDSHPTYVSYGKSKQGGFLISGQTDWQGDMLTAPSG